MRNWEDVVWVEVQDFVCLFLAFLKTDGEVVTNDRRYTGGKEVTSTRTC